MRIDRYEHGTMIYPDDYKKCVMHGIELVRRSTLAKRGEYTAKVLSTSRTYRIVGGNSRRLPWRVFRPNGANFDIFPNLPAALYTIALHEATYGAATA